MTFCRFPKVCYVYKQTQSDRNVFFHIMHRLHLPIFLVFSRIFSRLTFLDLYSNDLTLSDSIGGIRALRKYYSAPEITLQRKKRDEPRSRGVRRCTRRDRTRCTEETEIKGGRKGRVTAGAGRAKGGKRGTQEKEKNTLDVGVGTFSQYLHESPMSGTKEEEGILSFSFNDIHPLPVVFAIYP